MMDLLARQTRSDIEDFLYREADLLDTWDLVTWRQLFTAECLYVVPNLALPSDAPVESTLHLVVDDGHHLTERVKRLGKKTAHAEYPRSRGRRLISNVMIVERGDQYLRAQCNFVTYRTSQQTTDTYFGQHQYRFVVDGGVMKIQEKRTILDIGSLRPQGRLSIIV
ncbi:aromatic-ring-hydroxylating dioxygenase subunit beta [Hydrogenophaga sp.]|jgi:p-cumate 2,3-dioxygenase beta subunit|uniref:aromatic-ring-hydroxylating dioxygenase subunit beta n=1 Tax=Hydrogenophaga sp. TaxID=1904254 RepID=UPI003F71F61D